MLVFLRIELDWISARCHGSQVSGIVESFVLLERKVIFGLSTILNASAKYNALLVNGNNSAT